MLGKQRRQEKSRLYEEYKAGKLKKRRNAAKTKSKLVPNYGESSVGKASSNYIPASLLPPLSETIKSNKYAQSLNLNLASNGVDNEQDCEGDGQNEITSSSSKEEDEFYLYRQPGLNKALWETEPRPYFD